MTTNIAIAYHSGFGHTAKVAEAVAQGAKQTADTQVDIIKVDGITEADWRTLDAANAIIFGAPTYMGSASAQFKIFAEASSKKWFHFTWKDKIAAGFTNSASYSGDKLSTLQEMCVLAMQHGMIWVGLAEMPPHFKAGDTVSPDMINRIGSFTGLMTQSNHDAGPDIAPTKGDLETAKLFGKRIAEIAAKHI